MAQRESSILCMASDNEGAFYTYFSWDDVTNEIVRFRWDNTSTKTGVMTLTNVVDESMTEYEFAPGTGQSVNTRGWGYNHGETIGKSGQPRHYVDGYAVACALR